LHSCGNFNTNIKFDFVQIYLSYLLFVFVGVSTPGGPWTDE
jgi:hypothetical protein